MSLSAAARSLEFTRPICGGCRRPTSVCYCAFVTELATRTRLVILQHPRERKVPINTARIASLCLPDAELHVGVSWNRLPVLSDPTRPAALLYPGPGAIDVEQFPPEGVITLVVVDGTWWQTRKLVRNNPVLAALPRYAFRPAAPSSYRIRKEPHADYVSTIEALVHVLGVLERDPGGFVSMLAPFRAMVDAQVAFAEQGGRPRRVLRKRPAAIARQAGHLAILRERAADLVCVHAEANAWPYNASERTKCPDELVHWVACRPATGETLDVLVAPRLPLCPATPRHLDVDRSVVLGGVAPSALFERWAEFMRPSDIVCTWGTYSLSLFTRAGGTLPETQFDLRKAARMYAAAPVGTMGSFRAKLGVDEPSRRAVGRAGARLADLVAIASFMAR